MSQEKARSVARHRIQFLKDQQYPICLFACLFFPKENGFQKNFGITFRTGLINVNVSEKLFSYLKHFALDENHETIKNLCIQ